MGVTASCCKTSDDGDSEVEGSRAEMIVKAIQDRAEFCKKKESRVEYFIQLDHLSAEEKEQIVKIEKRRSKAERLSPREPRDLTFYHQVTFHVPDDPQDVATNQSATSNDCSVSENGCATATVVSSPTDGSQQQHKYLEQQRGSTTSHLQEDIGNGGPADGWSLAVFGTLNIGEGGGGGDTAVCDGTNGKPQRCIRVTAMDGSMSMSRSSLNSTTKKKSVSFSATSLNEPPIPPSRLSSPL